MSSGGGQRRGGARSSAMGSQLPANSIGKFFNTRAVEEAEEESRGREQGCRDRTRLMRRMALQSPAMNSQATAGECRHAKSFSSTASPPSSVACPAVAARRAKPQQQERRASSDQANNFRNYGKECVCVCVCVRSERGGGGGRPMRAAYRAPSPQAQPSQQRPRAAVASADGTWGALGDHADRAGDCIEVPQPERPLLQGSSMATEEDEDEASGERRAATGPRLARRNRDAAWSQIQAASLLPPVAVQALPGSKQLGRRCEAGDSSSAIVWWEPWNCSHLPPPCLHPPSVPSSALLISLPLPGCCTPPTPVFVSPLHLPDSRPCGHLQPACDSARSPHPLPTGHEVRPNARAALCPAMASL